MRVSLGRPACLAALAQVATSCTFPVEGQFAGRSLADRADPTRTIVLIYNHGFSRDTAGTYKPGVPPILQLAVDRNPDVVLFSQVRNASRLERTHHSDYIESAVELFRRRDGVPLENIILVGQSCGGWGSLQAAAFVYPGIGGVLAFAPTCHASSPTRARSSGRASPRSLSLPSASGSRVSSSSTRAIPTTTSPTGRASRPEGRRRPISSSSASPGGGCSRSAPAAGATATAPCQTPASGPRSSHLTCSRSSLGCASASERGPNDDRDQPLKSSGTFGGSPSCFASTA